MLTLWLERRREIAALCEHLRDPFEHLVANVRERYAAELGGANSDPLLDEPLIREAPDAETSDKARRAHDRMVQFVTSTNFALVIAISRARVPSIVVTVEKRQPVYDEDGRRTGYSASAVASRSFVDAFSTGTPTRLVLRKLSGSETSGTVFADEVLYGFEDVAFPSPQEDQPERVGATPSAGMRFRGTGSSSSRPRLRSRAV
jgi:hypothetical protein